MCLWCAVLQIWLHQTEHQRQKQIMTSEHFASANARTTMINHGAATLLASWTATPKQARRAGGYREQTIRTERRRVDQRADCLALAHAAQNRSKRLLVWYGYTAQLLTSAERCPPRVLRGRVDKHAPAAVCSVVCVCVLSMRLSHALCLCLCLRVLQAVTTRALVAFASATRRCRSCASSWPSTSSTLWLTTLRHCASRRALMSVNPGSDTSQGRIPNACM